MLSMYFKVDYKNQQYCLIVYVWQGRIVEGINRACRHQLKKISNWKLSRFFQVWRLLRRLDDRDVRAPHRHDDHLGGKLHTDKCVTQSEWIDRPTPITESLANCLADWLADGLTNGMPN